MSEPVPDLLIVGAGVIGLSLAEATARRGLRVAVLERERAAARASWAGAGMLNCRPWPRTRTPDYQDLVIASRKLYETWAARLKEETDIDVGFRRCGSLELFPQARAMPNDMADLERMLEGCRARQVKAERITPEEARRLEPGLDTAGIVTAVHLPDDCQVRPPRLGKALALACRQLGVDLREGVEVADVWVEDARARGVVTREGKRVPAAKVAVCAGAWTGQFPTLVRAAPRIGKIHPVRGQLLCYQAPTPLATRLLTVGHNYIVPRPDGITLIGSTMERVGFQAVTTPEVLDELRRFGQSLLPGLRELEPLTSWADLRPGLKGDHPILGPVPGVAGLFVAAGHFRNGLILAPITAEAVTGFVLGEPPAFPLEDWLPR